MTVATTSTRKVPHFPHARRGCCEHPKETDMKKPDYQVKCDCCGEVGKASQIRRITQIFNVSDKVDKTSVNVVSVTVFYGYRHSNVKAERRIAKAWSYTPEEFEKFRTDQIEYD